MRIRQASVETLTDLRARFIADVRGTDPGTLVGEFLDATRSFLRGAFAEGSMVAWIAEEADVAVGVVAVAVWSAPPRPDELRTLEGYVVNMYVAPDARRAGVGRRLVAACIDGCRERGVRRLSLHATDMGRPLYAEMGFAVDSSWMQRRLADR